MPKTFPIDQRNMVIDLANRGHSNVKIAEIMKTQFPKDWGAKTAHRTVGRILQEEKQKKESEQRPVNKEKIIQKSLDEMSREERYHFMNSKLRSTPRFRIAFNSFDADKKDLFVDEYLGVMKSIDSINEIEEQSLFLAILELILALNSLERKEKEEKYRDMSLNREIEETDPRYRRSVDDKYQKEYDQHMKLYQKGIEGLKMSRSQRLKEITSQKVSLIDVAQDLSSKNAQAEVADNIQDLAKLKDAELKRLLDEGHLHGMFDIY